MSYLGFTEPASLYINWASYDLLSDNVPLTETLAMTQLDHLLRLKRAGVRFDYYVMDAFWFDPDGGYRTWDKRHWSEHGPARWIARCHEQGLLPGLWVGTNSLATPIFRHLNVQPAWRDSLDAEGTSACLFHGGFLADFIAALQHWVDRGIRLFKFDFAELDAAPAEIRRSCLPSEIRRRNSEALRTALAVFRAKNPAVKLIAYNGFSEQPLEMLKGTALPVRRLIDTRWLDVFDTVYCGDPRPADVPCANFWRSKDIYSDHMVRYFEANGYPLPRIDNSAFMIGTTGTCYDRRKQAWRGMLVLSLARGGWANTYYGNLELLTDDDARWFASAQSLFLELQRTAVVRTFGGMPGEGKPYGFWAQHRAGDVFTVMNPSQRAQAVALPGPAERVLFHDAGFAPQLRGAELTLGPEQLAVVARGTFASERFDLGEEPDVVIPRTIRPVDAAFVPDGETVLTATCAAPANGETLRVIFRQARDGTALRSTGGAPPDGMTLGRILRLTAQQDGREVPVRIAYDKAIWSGLSWAVGEIDGAALASTAPLRITCSTRENPPVRLVAEVFFTT
jgi:hypothetical protein